MSNIFTLPCKNIGHKIMYLFDNFLIMNILVVLAYLLVKDIRI